SNAFGTTVYNDSTLTGISQVISGLSPATPYYWRVNAKISGGTGAYSSVWRFTTLGPPAAPVLVSPLNTAQNQPTSLTLSWLASVGADTYRLQIDTTSAFTSSILVFNDSTITNTSQPISGLLVGKTYYWRVNAKNAAGTSAYSARNFSTGLVAPQPPLLAAPPDGDTVLTTSPTLSWNPSTGAATYRLQIDTTVAFSSPTFVFDDSTITGLLQPVSGLTNGMTYYWRVNAKNSGGTSAYSNIWRFTVAPLPPSLLGSASTYGIMATSAITSTGNSIINGDVSLDPGTSMTGFPPAIVNGAIHINDLQSAQARDDLLIAYNYFKNLPPGTTIAAGADLGALYPSGIAPGTYTSGSTMLVSTPLVLDAGGNANAVWVFQIGSSLTTGANVTLLNGAQADNVYWVPTLDGTIGVGTTFHGTIVSGRDVTAVTGATINGRILAGATTAGTIALQATVVNVP
ncbi:MAG TPA: ice-binding family protein, partial [Bacteroidota bacterium]